MIALAALLLASAPALEAPAQAPLDMFRAACTQGSLALSRKSAAPVAFRDLPFGARAALGQSLSTGGEAIAAPAKPEDVPGPVYALGPDKSLFLLLPAGEGASGRFAHSCAIAWKGEHFAAARAAILPNPPADLSGQSPDLDGAGHAFVGTVAGNIYLSATTLRDWTVLRSVPQSEAPLP